MTSSILLQRLAICGCQSLPTAADRYAAMWPAWSDVFRYDISILYHQFNPATDSIEFDRKAEL